MLKYSVAVIALLASTSLACAQQQDRGSNSGAGGMSNSASEHAPGQMKDSGSSAKELAPGQNKGAGNSAKDLAPGRMKDSSASKSDDKSYEHRSQNETSHGGRDADRNAKDTSDRLKDSDHYNAKNDADRNSENPDRNAKDEGSSDRHNGVKKDKYPERTLSLKLFDGCKRRQRRSIRCEGLRCERNERAENAHKNHLHTAPRGAGPQP